MSTVKVTDRVLDWNWVVAETPTVVAPPNDKTVVMELFKRNLWKTPKSLGFIGTPSSPVVINGLRYEPLILDECNIPPAGWKRVNGVANSPDSTKEFYIGHEIVAPGEGIKIPWKLIAKIIGIAFVSVAAIGMVMAIAATVIMLLFAVASLLIPLLFVVALAAGVDPKICYRTSEGEWLVIFTYFT